MENLSELISALEEVREEFGNCRVLLRAGRNQNGEAVHRMRRVRLQEFADLGRAVVFEAVDEPDLGGL